MASNYGVGGFSGVSANSKKRKLPKVETFRDMQNANGASPSVPAGGGFQPGGFGPGAGIRKNVDPAISKGLPGGATGAFTGSGYTAPSTPPVSERTYSEASRPPAAGLGAPVGGFGTSRSPVFGAGAIPSFAQAPGVDTGVEGLEETGRQVPIGAEAGVPTGERGRGELTVEESMEELDWSDAIDLPEEMKTREELATEGIRPADTVTGPGVAGVAAEQAAGGLKGQEAAQTLDQEMQGLIDEHEASWGDTEGKLNAQLAMALRRQAEVNAAMGSSVSGGYAGATAATILGSLQVMADAFASHQKEGRNLQLAWLEKRMNMDFEREMTERQTARDALNRLLEDPLAEVTEEMWEEAYPDAFEREEAKEAHESGEGLPSARGSVEGGDLKNAEGHLYMGEGGLGTTGEISANPYSGDGSAHQWFAESFGEGEFAYYRLDEDGEKVYFRTGVDGGAYPGDKRARNNQEFAYNYEKDSAEWESDWGLDPINAWHRTSWGDANNVRVNELGDLAPLIMEMFMYEDPSLGANMSVTPQGEIDAGMNFASDASEQAFDNFYRAHHEEVISFMFATYADTGEWPSGQELQTHMRDDLGEQIVIFG